MRRVLEHEENSPDYRVLDVTGARNRLNELYEENQHIKQTIKTMMENERTDMGRSVLQQLWQAIQ